MSMVAARFTTNGSKIMSDENIGLGSKENTISNSHLSQHRIAGLASGLDKNTNPSFAFRQACSSCEPAHSSVNSQTHHEKVLSRFPVRQETAEICLGWPRGKSTSLGLLDMTFVEPWDYQPGISPQYCNKISCWVTKIFMAANTQPKCFC